MRGPDPLHIVGAGTAGDGSGMSGESEAAAEEQAIGLCVRCQFGATQESARGSRFWRCRRADSDPAFLRYPRLPVRDCPGFERRAAAPGAGDPDTP